MRSRFLSIDRACGLDTLLSASVSLERGATWKATFNRLFDLLKLIAERLPILNNLIVELAVMGLLLYALFVIFSRHP
jgi:hypothetical protein